MSTPSKTSGLFALGALMILVPVMLVLIVLFVVVLMAAGWVGAMFALALGLAVAAVLLPRRVLVALTRSRSFR